MFKMNNLYPTNEVYALRNDMCYENRAMAESIKADQLPSPHHTIKMNTGIDCEKPKIEPDTPKCRRCWPRRLRFTAVSDILTALVFLLIFLIVEIGILPQKKLGFRCKDPTISFPYTGDTINIVVLLLGSFLAPFFLFSIIEILREKSVKNVRIGIVWEHYKELVIGGGLLVLLTEIAKTALGEHRPHFFDVCRPDANEECIEGTFIDQYQCTSTDFSRILVNDSSRSFPSGHSALSVYVSLFCAYFVQTRLPSTLTGRLFKTFLIAICLSWGIVCSLSRIVDRRHHWWDVLFGVILGVLGVLFFATNFHKKQKNKLGGTSAKSISSTMLLDVKSKSSASARV